MNSGETWYRLRNWQGSQAEEERLAGQVLADDGYESIDPSHPLGGPDTGQDGRCKKDGKLWIYAVYFARGEVRLRQIKQKLSDDIEAARKHNPFGIVFVTNQELRLAERAELKDLGDDLEVDIFHLERVAHVLDQPSMGQVRQQYLGIPASQPQMALSVEVLGVGRRFVNTEQVRGLLVDTHEDMVRKREDRLRTEEKQRGQTSFTTMYLANAAFGWESDEPPPRTTPWTESEIQQDLSRYKDDCEGRWDKCMDYLASNAWPALHFRLTNEAKSFLKNVEVIVTFNGAAGVKRRSPERFDWEKLQDPDHQPQQHGPFANVVAIDPDDFGVPKEYPVHWRNKDGDLVVTISLPELRPIPAKGT